MSLPGYCQLCYGIDRHQKGCPAANNPQDSKPQYLIDLPNLHKGFAWECVQAFATKEAALVWIREKLGPCDDEGRLEILTTLEP